MTFDYERAPLCMFASGKPKDVCRDNNLTNYYAATSSDPLVEQFVSFSL